MESKLESSHFRTRPEEFFALSVEEQEGHLTEICGPKEGYIYTYNRDVSMDTSAYDSTTENMYDEIDNNAHYCQWSNVGRLMEFFNVEFNQSELDFLKYTLPNEHFDGFIKVFPFGCISELEEYQYEFSPENCVTEWIRGKVGEYLIPVCLNPGRISNEIFEQMIDSMDESLYFTDESRGIRQSIWGFHSLTLIKDHKVEIERRRNIIISIMTQKRLEDSSNSMDVYKFLYLTVCKNSILRPNIPIPKPRWSRESHGDLTIGSFTKESVIILVMQKFRYANFSLHKDLIDVVLKHLFELHLYDLEHTLEKRDVLYMKLNHSTNHQERLKFGLANGICLDDDEITTDKPGLNRELDIVHVHMGLMINHDDKHHYWKELRRAICRKSNIVFIGEHVKIDEFTALEFGGKIITYCRDKNIDLYLIFSDRVNIYFSKNEVVDHRGC